MNRWITNIRQIVTPAHDSFAACAQLKDLRILENHAIHVMDGRIVDILPADTPVPDGAEILDAGGRVVMPAFVDPHTHVVFAGTREDEFNMRLQGRTYMEIAAAGGGINSTVRQTREAGEDDLYRQSSENLDRMIAHGIATIEIKSGYGLETETELKQLRVVQRLRENFPVDIRATFMGAHEVPPEYRNDREAFIDLLCEEMLPAAREQGVAEYCDIFCETGVFDIEESRRILTRARELGFDLRMHADELTPLGGAELAAEMNALSADHLVHVSPEGIRAMAASGSVFVMLPGTTFFLRSDHYAPARSIVEAGGILALSTDFNPGSSHTHSMPLIITIACLKMGLTIEEAINAATINGAFALRLHNVTGSLHPGKQADLLFLDAPSYKFLVYNFGVNRISGVMKRGEWIYPQT